MAPLHSRSRHVRYGWLIALFGGAGFTAWLVWTQLRPFDDNTTAHVSWKSEGVPAEVRCVVIDIDGKPVPNATVSVFNNSGYQDAVTDAHGTAALRMGEYEVEEIQINGLIVMHRPFARLLRSPNVLQGLSVTVHLKSQTPTSAH